jgi:ABC-type phosphonate transport system ATPase subunit
VEQPLLLVDRTRRPTVVVDETADLFVDLPGQFNPVVGENGADRHYRLTSIARKVTPRAKSMRSHVSSGK